MKNHPIVLGIDDATFRLKEGSKFTFLIGVICQGTRLVKVEKRKIEIDGKNATCKIIDMIKKNKKHIQYVLTHTITFGGFNLINMKEVYAKTKKPLICIAEREVDLDSVKTALIHRFPDTYKNKLTHIINAGDLYKSEISTAAGTSNVYFHKIGITLIEAHELLEKSCIDSKLPEAVRIAHIIGRIFRDYDSK
ncbi:MAG: hypothetical protein BAJALOKI1v1_550017 [Promethearchaeota archaeon]|nr:MAG: hypothetical protein BAJALOKI1v1_550017 [Candidatus Lokiarchaeota archaeon]